MNSLALQCHCLQWHYVIFYCVIVHLIHLYLLIYGLLFNVAGVSYYVHDIGSTLRWIRILHIWILYLFIGRDCVFVESRVLNNCFNVVVSPYDYELGSWGSTFIWIHNLWIWYLIYMMVEWMCRAWLYFVKFIGL